jgi:hypothetical protein
MRTSVTTENKTKFWNMITKLNQWKNTVFILGQENKSMKTDQIFRNLRLNFTTIQ